MEAAEAESVRAWGSSGVGRAQTNRAHGRPTDEAELPAAPEPGPNRRAHGRGEAPRATEQVLSVCRTRPMLSFRETRLAPKGRGVGPGPQRLLWNPAGRKGLPQATGSNHTSGPLTPEDPVPSAPRRQPNRPNPGAAVMSPIAPAGTGSKDGYHHWARGSPLQHNTPGGQIPSGS